MDAIDTEEGNCGHREFLYRQSLNQGVKISTHNSERSGNLTARELGLGVVFVSQRYRKKLPQTGALRTTEIFIHSEFWRPEVQNQGVGSFGGLGGRICSVLLSWLLVVADNPRGPLACGCLPPPPTPATTPSPPDFLPSMSRGALPLHLYANSPPLIKTPVIGSGPSPI